jgi:hypothetical protein
MCDCFKLNLGSFCHFMEKANAQATCSEQTIYTWRKRFGGFPFERLLAAEVVIRTRIGRLACTHGRVG